VRKRLILSVIATAFAALSPRGAYSQSGLPAGPPSSPMTIPLPDPLFWDPVSATGDYAVVEQQEGLYLIRPTTGRVIARMPPPTSGGGTVLGTSPISDRRRTDSNGRDLKIPDGWPFRPGGEVPWTPVIADLDGDGSGETIFATHDGWIWVLSAGGLPPAGWPIYVGVTCEAGICVADMNRDGSPEIIAGDGSGRVHVFRSDGSYLAGWPSRIPGECELPAIEGAVAAADIDQDGEIETVVTQAIGRVCAFRANGRVVPGWPVATANAEDPPNAGTIFSRPALGDITGDGKCEVIVGANSYRIYIWTADGRALQGWPRLMDNRARVGYSDPVLADIDADGAMEIILATDAGFSGPARVYAINAQGRNVPGWPVNLPERCNGGVAVGDIDHNGRLDVVVATVGEESRVIVLDSAGRVRKGFPVRMPQTSVNSSPLLADVDGDGRTEIVVAGLRTRFEPATSIFAFDLKGESVPPFPIRLEGVEVVAGGPCIGDLDGDGSSELVLGTEVEGRVYAWNLPGSSEPRCNPWTRPGGDRSNTGVFRPPQTGGVFTGRREASAAQPIPPSVETERAEDAPPFSLLQSVSFVLREEGLVRLCITDLQRQTIRTLLDGALPSGAYTISWDGRDANGQPAKAGIYVYDLEIPGRRRTGQLLLVR
jgi:hypothetical protein